MSPVDLVLHALCSKFKHDNFKSKLQEDAIRCIVDGKHNVFVSMPTGAGKSLCFQLPAVLKTGISFVISPLLALIVDQLASLKCLKINAAALNSRLTVKERADLLQKLHMQAESLPGELSMEIKLLYVTPEQCETENFKEVAKHMYKNNRINYIIVDEAHCISEWGHDFRPAYLRVGKLRLKLFPNIPCVALTATANSRVKEDIIASLFLRGVENSNIVAVENLTLPIRTLQEFSTDVFRPNLQYAVIFPDLLEYPYNDLRDFIIRCLGWQTDTKTFMNQSGCGIVYCRTREDCETLAHQLSLRGIPSRPYHAGLSKADRTQVQNDWFNEVYPVVTATISFGMGVNKSNVRFVVHWTLPKSIAAYYQESGRAGRDGDPAFCRLYHARRERDAVAYLISQQADDATNVKKRTQRERGIQELDKMIAYAEGTLCRHAHFALYFGNALPECKDKCDICVKSPQFSKQLARFKNAAWESASGQAKKNDEPLDTDLYRSTARKRSEGWDTSFDGDYETWTDAKQLAANHLEEEDRNGRHNFILEEFARRKGGVYDNPKAPWAKAPKESPLLDPGNRSVVGITGQSRAQTLQLLVSAIQTLDAVSMIADDIPRVQLCAEAEYQIFNEAKVAAIYRGHMVRRIAQTRKAASLEVAQDNLLQLLTSQAAKRLVQQNCSNCPAAASAPPSNYTEVTNIDAPCSSSVVMRTVKPETSSRSWAVKYPESSVIEAKDDMKPFDLPSMSEKMPPVDPPVQKSFTYFWDQRRSNDNSTRRPSDDGRFEKISFTPILQPKTESPCSASVEPSNPSVVTTQAFYPHACKAEPVSPGNSPVVHALNRPTLEDSERTPSQPICSHNVEATKNPNETQDSNRSARPSKVSPGKRKPKPADLPKPLWYFWQTSSATSSTSMTNKPTPEGTHVHSFVGPDVKKCRLSEPVSVIETTQRSVDVPKHSPKFSFLKCSLPSVPDFPAASISAVCTVATSSTVSILPCQTVTSTMVSCNLPTNIPKQILPLSAATAAERFSAKVVADRVISALSYHYARGIFSSKDCFKSIARELTKRLTKCVTSPKELELFVKVAVCLLVRDAAGQPISFKSDVAWDQILAGVHEATTTSHTL